MAKTQIDKLIQAQAEASAFFAVAGRACDAYMTAMKAVIRVVDNYQAAMRRLFPYQEQEDSDDEQPQ